MYDLILERNLTVRQLVPVYKVPGFSRGNNGVRDLRDDGHETNSSEVVETLFLTQLIVDQLLEKRVYLDSVSVGFSLTTVSGLQQRFYR